MTIDVVLFDLDDTLFDHRDSVRQGIEAHRVSLGLPGHPAEEFARWNALEEVHYHRYLAGELDFFEQRRARARGFVEPHGQVLADPDADAWFEAYLRHYESNWQLHRDAAACLDRLDARGIRLGIITNGDISFQGAKLAGLGITDRFEHVIASGSVGVAKPDPRIFALACETFGVAPARAMYVGDRLHTDAIGAAAAGLRGVWLDRSEAASAAQLEEARAAGARVIHTLDQVDGLL
jgi:putative hydrolase of the HAD superfamily